LGFQDYNAGLCERILKIIFTHDDLVYRLLFSFMQSLFVLSSFFAFPSSNSDILCCKNEEHTPRLPHEEPRLWGLFFYRHDKIFFPLLSSSPSYNWGQTLKTLVIKKASGSGFVLMRKSGLIFTQEHLFKIIPDPVGTKRKVKAFKVLPR
jgi:hypothetical protein